MRIPHARVLLAAAGAAIQMLHVVALGAQRPPARPEPNTGWTARRVHLEGLNINAADRAYALSRLEEIERILLEVPAIAHPDGVELHAVLTGFYARAPRPNTMVEYRYNLGTTSVRQFVDHKSCDILEIIVNQSPTVTSSVDERGRPVIFERPLGKEIPGASIVWERLSPTLRSFEYVVFTPDGESPWIQLTREEVRKFQIFDAEGSNGEKTAEFRKSRETTRYQQFMAEAAQRKKERDELAASLKGLKSAAEIATLIRELENAERETAAQLKASESEDRRQNDTLLNAPTYADRVRASLAAMSPAERQLPAFIAPGGETGYEFVSADAPFAQRVVTENPDFWRARTSRVAVRSISVGFQASCGSSPPPPPVHRALWTLHEEMDWAAFRRMVNAKP